MGITQLFSKKTVDEIKIFKSNRENKIDIDFLVDNLLIKNNKNYKDALNIYNLYNGKYVSSGNENYNNIALSYLKQKTFYQDQRDLVAIYIGLTYLLNVIDAYVDAEMYDFSFKENSVDKSPMLNLRIKF